MKTSISPSKSILSLITALLFAGLLPAQTSWYGFTQSTLNITYITGATPIVSGPWITGQFGWFATPFPVTFFGTPNDSIFVSVDGWVGFDNFPDGRIDVFRTATRGVATPVQSMLHYAVTGNPGSRVLTIEWKNAILNESVNDEAFSVQLIIREGSDCFDINMGTAGVISNSVFDDPFTTEVETGPKIGLRDDIQPDLLYLTSNPNAPTLYTDLTQPVTEPGTLTGAPAGNTLYTFCPSTVSASNPLLNSIHANYDASSAAIHIQCDQQTTFTSLALYDYAGRTLAMHSGGTGTQFTLPASGITPGIYFLALQSGDKTSLKRIFIYP